ncbi:unnamed protein product, partial [Allacma fusca]
MGYYYVVQFVDCNLVNVVPSPWMFDNNQKCNWPENITEVNQLTTLQSKATDPTDYPRIFWKEHECRVILGTDDFLKARKAVKKFRSQNEVDLTDTEASTLKTGRVLRSQITKTRFTIPDITTSPQNEIFFDIISEGINVTDNDTTDHAVPFPNVFSTASTSELNVDAGEINNSEQENLLLDEFRNPCVTEHGSCSCDGKLEELIITVHNIVVEFRNFEKVTIEKLVKLQKETDHLSCTLGKHLVSA